VNASLGTALASKPTFLSPLLAAGPDNIATLYCCCCCCCCCWHRLQAIVQSFFEFGLQSLRPQVGGFDWRQLHELNEAIAWQDWASCILEQHQRGALDMDRWLTERASRRRASVAASNGGGETGGGRGLGSEEGVGDGRRGNERGVEQIQDTQGNPVCGGLLAL
jgi:hypothetical protein